MAKTKIKAPVDVKVVLRWIAIVISVIWIGLSSVSEFIGVDSSQYSFRDGDVREQLSRCEGTFQQRYDCKQKIILQKDRSSFVGLMEKLAVILGPPILLGGLFFLLRWQIERQEMPTPSPNRYKTRHQRLEESSTRQFDDEFI